MPCGEQMAEGDGTLHHRAHPENDVVCLPKTVSHVISVWAQSVGSNDAAYSSIGILGIWHLHIALLFCSSSLS